MIKVKDQHFLLETKHTAYLFKVNNFGHLEHIYYGGPVLLQDAEALAYKRTIFYGSQIMYSRDDSTYCLDNVSLEWSGSGKGDFRHSPLELEFADGTFTTDFIFDSYEIIKGSLETETLPVAYGKKTEAQVLLIKLKEKVKDLDLHLIYSVFPETDVITRRSILINRGKDDISVHKFMSMMLDLPKNSYKCLTLNGDWNAESNVQFMPVAYGIQTNNSSTGNSSNRHNPAIALAEKQANEDWGEVYGFNLVYSGNHASQVEQSSRDFVRISQGINYENFHWELRPGQQLESPECVMTYSNHGFNGMSQHFHEFIHRHILRGDWRDKERPILINNWEAHYFDYNHKKLINLAKKAQKLGVELFVLDDGWFANRNSDTAGLGDYTVNFKKLPKGLAGLANQINQVGMAFGLWFEPESVNEDSDLYRQHPDYAIQMPGREASLGRNQLLLDLSKEEVQDYIVENICRILDSVNISYIKWDMNRHLSDVYSASFKSGEFVHRYMIGLYQVLKRIFWQRPHILLEMCSSGGNRFDLGMLSFANQIWASDNTDPIERLRIQKGLSYFYPQSTMGAHVSASPHNQTLRRTPLSTRFNVAAFGAFGYELDLAMLTKVQLEQIKNQIIFYKKYRRIFQYGKFIRYDLPEKNREIFQVVDDQANLALIAYFNLLAKAGESNDRLRIKSLKAERIYRLDTVQQKVEIANFGQLINHISPIKIRDSSLGLSLVNRYYALDDGKFSVEASGQALAAGIGLNNQYIGTGYHQDLRLWGDFGSQLYVVEALKETKD